MKHWFVLSFLAHALITTPALAKVDDGVAADFKKSAVKIPSALTQLGYSKVGDIDLNSFADRLGSVNVIVAKSIAHKQQVDSFQFERDSAEWRRSHGQSSISINGSLWRKTKSTTKPMLALHESLGAFAISDDDFGCSSNLWALSDNETRSALHEDELSQFEKNAQRSCVQVAMAGGTGGGTGVAGGGDGFNVEMRQRVVQSGITKLKSQNADRANVMEEIEAGLYRGYGINPHHAIIDPKTALSSITLPHHPVVSTIHVITYEGTPVPQDPVNGWTYEASTNRILFHGAAVPKKSYGGMMASPGVLCQWAD